MRAEQELIRLGFLYGAVLIWAVCCVKFAVPSKPLGLGIFGARRYRSLHNSLVGVGALFCMILTFTGQPNLLPFLGASAILVAALYGMQEGRVVGTISRLVQSQYDASLGKEPKQAPINLARDVGVCPPPSIETSLSKLLQHAIKIEAESIHLRPSSQNTARVYFSVNGERKRFETIKLEVVAQIVNVLESWKLTEDASNNRAGSGWLRFPIDGAGQLFAYRSHSTARGAKLTIQLFARTARLIRGGLPSLGLDREQINSVRQYLSRPSGMLLVCGPRHNGKSTTGFAMVAELAAAGRCASVLQRAPGFVLDSVKTFVASPKQHDAMPRLIVKLRRQGPGVMLVDDVNKNAELVAAAEAASLDQLLVVTVPVADAHNVFKSVVTKVADRLVLETSMMGIIEQRLLRRLCTECCRQSPLSYAERVALGIEGSGQCAPVGCVPVGCNACRGTGYQGRVGVFSVIDCGPVWAKWRKRTCRHLVLKELRDHKLQQVRSGVAKKVLEGVCTAVEARGMLEADAHV